MFVRINREGFPQVLTKRHRHHLPVFLRQGGSRTGTLTGSCRNHEHQLSSLKSLDPTHKLEFRIYTPERLAVRVTSLMPAFWPQDSSRSSSIGGGGGGGREQPKLRRSEHSTQRHDPAPSNQGRVARAIGGGVHGNSTRKHGLDGSTQAFLVPLLTGITRKI